MLCLLETTFQRMGPKAERSDFSPGVIVSPPGGMGLIEGAGYVQLCLIHSGVHTMSVPRGGRQSDLIEFLSFQTSDPENWSTRRSHSIAVPSVLLGRREINRGRYCNNSIRRSRMQCIGIGNVFSEFFDSGNPSLDWHLHWKVYASTINRSRVCNHSISFREQQCIQSVLYSRSCYA